MRSHEKIEAVCGWLQQAKLDTSKITLSAAQQIWDMFEGKVIPDRIGLEIALGKLNIAQS